MPVNAVISHASLACLSLVSLACVGAPARFIGYGGTKERDCVRESADLYIRDYQELIHELQRPVDSQNQAE